nr:MAG TPA: hypothetical protein [Caudoviricetes sp.]
MQTLIILVDYSLCFPEEIQIIGCRFKFLVIRQRSYLPSELLTEGFYLNRYYVIQGR